MVKGIAHTALYAKHFDETIQFYQEVFDAETLGFFETDKRGCWLSIGGDILEIFESSVNPDGCFKHIAISCEDAGALLNKALRHGAEPYVSLKEITLNLKEPVHARIAFVKGINGEQIELFEEKELV